MNLAPLGFFFFFFLGGGGGGGGGKRIECIPHIFTDSSTQMRYNCQSQ